VEESVSTESSWSRSTSVAKLVSLFLGYYPQYDLDHILNKSFRNGGLTKGQIIILFTHASEAEYNRLRTQALFNACAVGGEDPENIIQRVKKSSPTSHQSLPNQSTVFPAFDHPDKYKDLSPEEKEVQTKRMMQAHKVWANTDPAMTDFGKD
jgi:hypothetical protein